MKIQLSRYFQVQQSPLKSYLGKAKQQLKQSKQSRGRRFSLNTSMLKNSQYNDPLNQQIQQYQPKMNKVKTSHCHAYTKMKNYMNQQQIKLKHIRLQDIKQKDKFINKQFQSNQQFVSSEQLKAISSVDDFFRNQKRDVMIYENARLNDMLENRVLSVDNTVKSLKLKPNQERKTICIPDNEPEIDKTIAKNKQKNKKLLNKLLKQKTEIKSGIDIGKYKKMSEQTQLFKTKPIERARLKLKGLSTVFIQSANQTRSVSPTIALLHELKNLSQTQLKKQIQLDAILKNQHQNRSRNLNDKANYYSDSVQLKRINASTMFKTRKIMNQKLLHRLKVSKDQGKNFSNFLLDLKDERVLICNSLRKVFEKIRLSLVTGKILREEDFDSIVEEFEDDNELKLPHNVMIINKIKAIMI